MKKEDIFNKAYSLSGKAEVASKIMPKSSIIAASIDMAEWVLNNLWKPADGEDLPDIDREVICALLTLFSVAILIPLKSKMWILRKN